MKDADTVLKDIKREKNVSLRALIPNLRGLERALEAKVDKVKLMLSATDSHSLHNANSTTMKAMDNFIPLLDRAKYMYIKIAGSISVAFDCLYEGVVPLDRLINICLCY